MVPSRRPVRPLRLGTSLLGAALVVAMPHPLAAQEPPSLVVIFDGSGSMWGNPEGERRNKLTLARDAMKAGLARVGRETSVGLVSFGHRRSGDCNDVETLVKPEAGTVERIGGALDKLSPRGRGPITTALREAAKLLPPAPAQASVVLVHDDADNCQLDPCSAVGDLRRANPRVVVHVVSIGLKKDDATRFACLPRATGGRHAEAQSAAQITVGIDEVLRLAGVQQPESQPAAQTPAQQPAPRQPAAAVPQPDRPGVQLRVALTDGGPPLEARARWRVTRKGGAAPVWEGDAVDPLLALPTGRYDIEAWLGFVKARGEVNAVEGTPQPVQLTLGAGLLQLPPGPTETAAPEVRRALADVVVTLKRVDAAAETIAFQRGLEREVALVPGNYVVSITVGAMRHERAFGIVAGQTTAFDANLALGAAEITPVALADGSGLGGTLLTLFEDDPEAPQGRREIWRSAASPAQVVLPAGNFYLVARRGTAETRERITVKAGELERRTVVLELARLAVTARVAGGRADAGEPVSHRLERLDGERETSVSNEAQATFHVAAGRYRLESRIGLANASVQRELDLKVGARDQLALELPAGQVRLRWLDQPNGNPLPDVAWEIRDAGGRVVWSGNQTEARPLLLAGRYTVRAEARERRLERALDVRAGEARVMDLVGQ